MTIIELPRHTPPSGEGKQRFRSDCDTPSEIIKQFQSVENSADIISLMLSEINTRLACERALFILSENFKPQRLSGKYGSCVYSCDLNIKTTRLGVLLVTRNNAPFLYREILLIEWLQMLAISRLAELNDTTAHQPT